MNILKVSNICEINPVTKALYLHVKYLSEINAEGKICIIQYQGSLFGSPGFENFLVFRLYPVISENRDLSSYILKVFNIRSKIDIANIKFGNINCALFIIIYEVTQTYDINDTALMIIVSTPLK